LTNNQNITHFFIFILSLILIFIGVFSTVFTYTFYPTLVPSYGAGEPFDLTSYNNYTVTFPWFSNSKLHLTIKANTTIQIYIEGKNVYNGTYYKLSIKPKDSILITIKSNSPATGRFEAWQEPLWWMQVGSLIFLFTGCILTILSFIYWIWSRKKN
jgi:hypothetical protein